MVILEFITRENDFMENGVNVIHGIVSPRKALGKVELQKYNIFVKIMISILFFTNGEYGSKLETINLEPPKWFEF